MAEIPALLVGLPLGAAVFVHAGLRPALAVTGSIALAPLAVLAVWLLVMRVAAPEDVAVARPSAGQRHALVMAVLVGNALPGTAMLAVGAGTPWYVSMACLLVADALLLVWDRRWVGRARQS